MRRIFLCLSFIFTVVQASAEDAAKAPDAKAMALVERGPLHLGSVNSGFKVSEDYFDANLNLVAPVWSSMGSDGLLGGGVVFLEPYVSWGEGGEVATSLGLGWRYLFNDQPVSALRSPRDDQAGFLDEGVAIGASLFVDMLDTEADNQFWQLGFGLEVASRYLELRGNYYLPLTDRQLAERRTFTETRTSSRTTTRPVTQTSAPYDNGQGFMVQDQTTSLYATTTVTTTSIRHILERYEEGMEGWDAELALLVPGLDKWCDVKLIGGYFSLDNAPFGPQTGGTGNVEGWKAGVEIRPVPALAVTGMWYEDERFIGSDWMVGLRMEIPFEAGDLGDGKGMWGRIKDAFKPRRRHLAERMAEPVRRQNAAIHLASSTRSSSSVSQQTATTSVQVISQTKKKIVLGLGPSATNFAYAGGGMLTMTNGASSSSYSGALYVNQIGNSFFVPDGGGTALIFPAGTVNSGSGIVRFTPGGSSGPYAGSLVISGTLNSGSYTTSAASDRILTAGGTLNLGAAANITHLTAGSLVTDTSTSMVTLGNLLNTAVGDMGGSVTLNQATNALNSGVGLIKLGAGTLTLGGGTPSIGTTVISGGTLNLGGTNTITGSNLSLQTGSLNLGGTRVLSIANVGGNGLTLPSSLGGVASLVLSRSFTINGTAVPSGTYPITNGTISVNGATLQLGGATLSQPATP